MLPEKKSVGDRAPFKIMAACLVREALFALYGFPGSVFVSSNNNSRFAVKLRVHDLAYMGALVSLARTATVAAKLRLYVSSRLYAGGLDSQTTGAFRTVDSTSRRRYVAERSINHVYKEIAPEKGITG